MTSTFIIGEMYRNRAGEYEVVEIDGPQMVIRYTDGQLLETRVALQARILANMKAERAIREEARQRASRKSYRASRKAIAFAGLLEGDFQRGITGTTWRARTGLGGLLAQRLSAETGQEFRSYAIYRRAEVHIVRPDCYNNSRKIGSRKAKLVFDLDEDGARYGLYIEKNDGPIDETWHWPNLLAALKADEALQERTLAAMGRLELEWEISLYGSDEHEQFTRVAAGEECFAWKPEGGEEEAIGWPELIERLSQFDESQYCDLYLCTRLGKTETIAEGARIAEVASAVYRALLPLYDVAVGASDKQA